MKPFLIFLFLFFTFFNLYPEEQHSYGPVKDQNWYTYAYSASSGSGPHYIGDNAGGGLVVTYICFVNWQWDEMNIPNEATLTSINIKFKAQTNNYSQRNFDFTLHWIDEDWSTVDFDTYAHDIYNNDNRKVFGDSKNSNASGNVSYEKTVTNGKWFDDVKNAITNSNHYMTLAIRSESGEYPFWEIYGYDGSPTNTPSIGITFNFTTPTPNYTFFNKFGSNESYGDLVLNNDYQNPFPSGTTKHPVWGLNTVRTDELPFDYNWNQSGTTQKHLYWSQTGVADNYVLNNDFQAILSIPVTMKATFDATAQVNVVNNIEGMIIGSGDVKFVDPFYYYEDNHIWHQDNESKTYSSPFTTSNNSENSYGGVFLDQDFNVPGQPYYSVQAISPQPIVLGSTIGTRNFYFQNWSADPSSDASFESENSITSGVVFNNDGVTINANLKGQGLTVDPNTFINGGERKVVQTPGLGTSSTLHRVYQDMGYVWYETSTDNGQNWDLRNDGQTLGVGGGKNPAIDWAYMDNTGVTYVAVVFQHPHPDPGHGYDIVLNLFGKQSLVENMGSFKLLKDTIIYRNFTSSTFDANPVVAISPYNQTATLSIVWQTSSGLYFYAAYIDEDPNSSQLILTAKPPELIPNTSENSINPTLGVTKINYNTTFGLAWEENNTIKYRTISTSSYGSINTISNYDGYTYNNNPSLVMLSDNYARVCWRAARFVSQIDPITETDNSYWDIRTIFKGSNNNRFWHLGMNVGNPSINKSDPEDYYAIIWNQDENQTFFADNHLGDPYRVDDFPGSRVQVTNGPSKNQMYADVLNTQSLPYYFKTSGSLGSYYYPSKVTGYTFASGREGVIAKDTAQFYFAVGDVKVDDDGIDFITIPDSIEFTSNEILNTYLVSEPFQLTDNSTFLYSIEYGITDSSAAANLLSNSNKYINFKLQLIDEQTSEVLGTYDDVTFDQSNIYQYNNLSYQVNTEGIGSRTAYLRLVTDNNFDAGYSLAEIYSAGDVLQKTIAKTTRYNGLGSVTTYDLSQNFPNPFNPATTINYRLPQTGFVTLKIYDILGKEVTTLVNERKTSGRYSVNFDGSGLASGIYIYQLRVNDYVSSKKMILLK